MTAQPRNGHDNQLTSQMIAAGEVGRQMCEPAVKAMAQSSAELMGLASRRAQAYIELPARFGACRSPQDLLAEQTRFAQTAWTHYVECCTSMMSAYQALAPQSAGMAQVWQSALRLPGAAAGEAGRDRDYLAERDEGPDPTERRSGQSRRAA